MKHCGSSSQIANARDIAPITALEPMALSLRASCQSTTIARPRCLANKERIVVMAWALLSIAGILEIAFALCMKMSEGFTRLIPALFTIVTGLSSVFLLSLSLRTLPVGTGYAVWTGIGAAGTAIFGILFLGDSPTPMRLLCIIAILSGVIGLKLVSAH